MGVTDQEAVDVFDVIEVDVSLLKRPQSVLPPAEQGVVRYLAEEVLHLGWSEGPGSSLEVGDGCPAKLGAARLFLLLHGSLYPAPHHGPRDVTTNSRGTSEPGPTLDFVWGRPVGTSGYAEPKPLWHSEMTSSRSDSTTVETRHIDDLKLHDQADLVPEMSDSEWSDLLTSVDLEGIREPLRITPAGVVLDGRHRLRAAKQLGLDTVPCLRIETDDEISYMVQAATLRRQLSKSQLACIAVELEQFEQERMAARQRMSAGSMRARQGKARVPDHEPRSPFGQARDRIGARVGVSGRLVQTALRLRNAAPDLFASAKSGEINLPEARRRLKQRQRANVEQAPRALRSPRLYVADAENLEMLNDASIDLIITSPPFNLGVEQGQIQTKASRRIGDERVAHGIAWRGPDYEVRLPESEYQAKQIRVLAELFRVAKAGATLFYHHRVRILDNVAIHPLEWLLKSDWKLRQEIVIDRESTHQHNPRMFAPVDERLYWLFKGDKPTLPGRPISLPTVWRMRQRGRQSWHPCPLLPEIPKRCLEAVGIPGQTVLDPFGGSMVVPRIALELGFNSIGVDIREDYVDRTASENGWEFHQKRLLK